MKKVLMMAVAVAVAVAFSAAVKAGDTTKTVEKEKATVGDVKVEAKTVTKENTATGTTKTVEKEKVKAGDVKVEAKSTTVENKAADTTKEKIKVEEKVKGGAFVEEKVTFKKFDANGDYIYVVKGKEEMKVKHTLSEGDKANIMKKKDGDTITITSTYPLTKEQVMNNVVTSAK